MKTKPPGEFKLSKSMLNKLPAKDRAGAAKTLWLKSAGICALCDRPLGDDGKKMEPDHRIAEKEASGGETRLDNLYLAHKYCNRSRQNLPFEIAQKLIHFSRWCADIKESTDHYPQFGDFAKEYLPNGQQSVKFTNRDGWAEITFGAERRSSPVAIDPSTDIPYFFTEVPATYIKNDSKTQPRRLEPDHVRTLAVDFVVRPVHEPSNCRLERVNDEVADLLQFDGQHKTVAQILLGRQYIQMKIYVEPEIALIQDLVLQIQQGIKKRPLSMSDTLRKLHDVIKKQLDEYRKPDDSHRSETGFIAAQPLEAQKKLKQRYLEELYGLVLRDDDNEMKEYVSKGKSKEKPIADRVIVNKIIKPLVYYGMLSSDMDSEKFERDIERKNLVFVLNKITEYQLHRKWKGGAKLDLYRARNFFYQGSIGWWLHAVLVPAIRNVLQIPDAQREKTFLRTWSRMERKKVEDLVRVLCGWPMWSTIDTRALKAMRSNTIKDVVAEFECYKGDDYNEYTLARAAAR